MVASLVLRRRAMAPLVACRRREGEGVEGDLPRAPPQSEGLGRLQE